MAAKIVGINVTMIVSMNVCMTFTDFLSAEELNIDCSPRYINVPEGMLLGISKN